MIATIILARILYIDSTFLAVGQKSFARQRTLQFFSGTTHLGAAEAVVG